MKMHADEVDTDESLVRRLLAAQFPRWAELPIAPVESTGTVNAIYRLGDDMAVRLPRVQRWASGLELHQMRLESWSLPSSNAIVLRTRLQPLPQLI